MHFVPSRLRHGEVIAGVSGVLSLAFTFLLTWYQLKTPLGWTAATLGVQTSFTGWQALSHLHWLLLLTPLTAIALFFLQGTRRAPAVPVAVSQILTVLGLITALLMIYRVLINTPGTGNVQRTAGAYLGLVSALGIVYGAYASLRQEGIAPADGPSEIETVKLDRVARV